MSTVIELDSQERDRRDYPNPCDYQITAREADTWFSSARQIRAFPSNASQKPLEFVTTVDLGSLILPWNAQLVEVPHIYLKFNSTVYDDRYLVNAINGTHSESNFVCEQCGIQYASDGTTPMWIKYKPCHKEQTMRFKRNSTYNFRITSRNGDVLPFFIDPNTGPIDPELQVLATFTVTPFIRDADYHNQTTETTTL
jgi:hypothetical protein